MLKKKNFVKDLTVGMSPSQIYKYIEESNDGSNGTL